ncbi:Uncharacterized protein dnm_039790 [Desulfonema magnum]|uniref:Uncharacterized protein n=1 Tax=Desulfonema magnum TaxID=45655 RepID=A0A975BN31_9BACT|nr:Uncharacterized protein dnm_039790 [Desulfonema magnum]
MVPFVFIFSYNLSTAAIRLLFSGAGEGANYTGTLISRNEL